MGEMEGFVSSSTRQENCKCSYLVSVHAGMLQKAGRETGKEKKARTRRKIGDMRDGDGDEHQVMATSSSRSAPRYTYIL